MFAFAFVATVALVQGGFALVEEYATRQEVDQRISSRFDFTDEFFVLNVPAYLNDTVQLNKLDFMAGMVAQKLEELYGEDAGYRVEKYLHPDNGWSLAVIGTDIDHYVIGSNDEEILPGEFISLSAALFEVSRLRKDPQQFHLDIEARDKDGEMISVLTVFEREEVEEE
jgi:hypothetical protein